MESDSSPVGQRAKALGAMLEQLKHPEDAASASAVSYLASRASATTHDFVAVANWLYPDNGDLMEFERNRFNNLATLGKPSAWNGIIERTWSEATILDCTATKTEVRLTIRDWTKVQWRPAPVSVHRTLEQEALVHQSPEKYGLYATDFPFIHSGFSANHEIRMVRTSRGWVVFQDDYDEPILTLKRISGVQTSLATVSQLKTESTLDYSHPTDSSNRKQEQRSQGFDWAAAANYGAVYAQVGNAAYNEFWPKDCANFTSQCFAAGGYPIDNTWAPYTQAWINSRELRNWLLETGKGIPTDQGALGLGDIINYSHRSNGVHEGVAIVTGLPGPLISCHSSGHLNIPYRAIASPGTTFLYTTTLDRY